MGPGSIFMNNVLLHKNFHRIQAYSRRKRTRRIFQNFHKKHIFKLQQLK